MAKKQPLYPHIPKSRMPAIPQGRAREDIGLRFLPDSPEFIAQTINSTGYRPQLEKVVRDAIARANRR